MKINDIKALAELVSKNNLSALEYSEGETHLRIENAPRTVTVAPAQAAPAAAPEAGHSGWRPAPAAFYPGWRGSAGCWFPFPGAGTGPG